jgi:hypothetical protein
MVQLLGPAMLLGGLGLSTDASAIDGFLLAHPHPSSSEVADFLKAFAPADRSAQAQALIARGVSSRAVSAALTWLEASSRMRSHWPTVMGVLSLASAAASGYHGYRRNASIGWAAIWFAMGSIFPVFTPVVAVAQGYGQKKGS